MGKSRNELKTKDKEFEDLMLVDKVPSTLYLHWRRSRFPYNTTAASISYFLIFITLQVAAIGFLVCLCAFFSPNWEERFRTIFYGDLGLLSSCLPDAEEKEGSFVICSIGSEVECGLAIAGMLCSLSAIILDLITYLRPLTRKNYTPSIDLRHIADKWRQRLVFIALILHGISICFMVPVLFIGLHLSSLITSATSYDTEGRFERSVTDAYGEGGTGYINALNWAWLVYLALVVADSWMFVGPLLSSINHPHVATSGR